MHLRERDRPTLLVRSFDALADAGGVEIRLRGKRRSVTIRMSFDEAREAVRLVGGLCGGVAAEATVDLDDNPF